MASASNAQRLVLFQYDLLPIGQIKPAGWIKDQLDLSADGLPGHLFDFYRYVQRSLWLGGEHEYSELHEAAPYWYNALVPLAYLLNDERLKKQVNHFLDYVLDHQAEDGWLGPETDPHERGIWARLLLLQGMVSHAIADAGREEEIVLAMHRFTKLTHTMLQNNYQGYLPHENDTFDPFQFGVSRAHEYSLSLQWLYQEHPRDQGQVIWEVMDLMWDGAAAASRDWRTFFTPELFRTGASPPLPKALKHEHGVTLSQGLRYMSQMFRMNHDEALVLQTRSAVDMTFLYQVGPAGSIVADEYLGARSPQRGSELCMSVEMIYSMAYLYRLHGDNDYADKAEFAAFNPFPAGISADWWSHQYVTQINQPWSRDFSELPYFNVTKNANVFGLEPNFPCCTVNLGQAYPKFMISAVTSTGDRGLLHQFLVPFTLTKKFDNETVQILCETKYPFGNVLRYQIKAKTHFDFFLRVPGWATAKSRIEIIAADQEPKKGAFSANQAGHYHVPIQKGTYTIKVSLDSEVRVVTQADGHSVSIVKGPLLYALETEYTETQKPVLGWPERKPLPVHDIHQRTHDHELLPIDKEWFAVAIDPTQIKVHDQSGSPEPLANPIFTKDAPPIHLTVAATKVEWGKENDTAALPPASPKAVGDPFVAKFVPYGSAKLHMAQLPTLVLPRLEL